MKILATGAFNYAEEQLNKIKNLGHKVDFVPDERIKLDIDVSSYEAVICNGLFINNDIRKFTNLKYIQLTSAGFDRVPIDYVVDNKIVINNAKGVYSKPIAEWVILKILEVYKNSKHFIENQKRKQWIKERKLLELTNKTALIIGMGDIGQEIAKKLNAFDVNINCVDIVKSQSKYIDKSYLTNELDDAVKFSDIVILTLPLTDDTYHLFNYNRFKNFKENSILINVSRGKIIDEKDLIKALEENLISTVILDVFENEPLQKESELWKFENIIITPHNSFVGELNNERLYDVIYNNLKEFSL